MSNKETQAISIEEYKEYISQKKKIDELEGEVERLNQCRRIVTLRELRESNKTLTAQIELLTRCDESKKLRDHSGKLYCYCQGCKNKEKLKEITEA